MKYNVRPWRYPLAMALLLVGALAITACGSSDDSTTTSSGSSTGSADSSLPPTPDAKGADVKGAQAFVKDHLGIPKFEAAGKAFDVKSVTKPVWLITATSSVPPVPQVNEAFEQAGKAAGVPVHVCPGNSTPTGFALCFKQAIQAGAGSVIFFSLDIDSISEPIKEARAAGIKVISGNNDFRVGADVDPRVDGGVSHDYFGAGQLNAAYALAERGGELDSLCIYTPEIPNSKSVCDGFQETLDELCPSCKLDVKPVPLAELATQTGAIVNTKVLSNPKLNFVMACYDAMTPLVVQKLRQLGKKPDEISVGGENGTPQALQQIKDGNYQVVSAGQSPGWWGWAFFDAAARAQVGALKDSVVVTQPNELFTKEGFKYDGKISVDNADDWFGFGDGKVYKDGYQALWKKD